MTTLQEQSRAPIEDFASGYGYFAALEIEALAERYSRTVLWRPFTLGGAFKIPGAQGLSRTPLKRGYAWHDWSRLARLKGVPFNLPADHPNAGLAAIRAFFYLDRKDARAAASLAKNVIISYFQVGLDTDDPQAIAAFAAMFGFDRDLILAGIGDPEVKATARQRGEEAISRGVFGSPWIFVDGEPFWGSDRLRWSSDGLLKGRGRITDTWAHHTLTSASRRSIMTVRKSSRPIARVFRATAAPGCRDELLRRFHSSSAVLVNSKVGCLGYRILESVGPSAPEVVFESIRRDLDAVKVAFGDAWQQSYLPECYSALMTTCSVHHFLVSESSTTK